jgi:hypothetical protein
MLDVEYIVGCLCMTGRVSTGTWTVIVGTGAWGEASASFPDDAIMSLGYDSEGGKR